MAGLLDFIQTPQGIGLLSAVAGGLAGARRGTPINNLGRGAAAGLMGYQSAQEQMRKDQEDAATKLALQNAIAAGTVNTTIPGQSPFAMVGGNAYANPSDANFELSQNKAINEMNQPPLNIAGKLNPGTAQTFPLPMSHVIPRSALSSVSAEDGMMSKIYDDFANPIQPTSEPDVYRNDLLTAWAPEQAAPSAPMLPEQAQQFAGTPDRVTQDFDLGKTAKAMIQSGRPELMAQGLKMLSEVKTGDPRTTEQKNWEYAMSLPEDQRQKFMERNGSGSLPSSVQEWNYYNQLPPADQARYLEMKRSFQWQDMGGYAAPRMPGGKLGPGVQKTMPPAAAVAAGQRQRELDYTTPSPKQAQKFSVTDPSGVTHYFPSREAADGFKRAIGGQ